MHKDTLIKQPLSPDVVDAIEVTKEVPQATQKFPLPQAQVPLSTIQTFCRSKTFMAESGVNPLVACASALFSLTTKLAQAEHYDDITQLRENITHEIKAFQSAAYTRHYRDDQILIARFAICATIDEIILHSRWGASSSWYEQTLLSLFQGETHGNESFFALLERLLQYPEQHLELLEFFYICLSIGFKGKYRDSNEDQQYEHTLERLYQIIRDQRGDVPLHLSPLQRHFKTPKKPSTKTKTLSLPVTFVITSLLLAAIYAGLSFTLQLSIEPVITKLAEYNHE